MTQAEEAIRLARPRDRGAVEGIVRAAYAPYVGRIGKPPGPMLDDYARLITGNAVHLLEAADGSIAAMVVLVAKPDHLLLDNIAVRPDRQHRGLGRRLVAFAEDEARRLGFGELRLYTHEKMTENIALYARLGFVETGRGREAGYDRVFMTKRLGDEVEATPLSWQIGRVKVTKIVELEVTGGSRFVLPQATRRAILPIAWLRPDFADEAGRLKMSVHALVVETPRRRIIVDTCLGNDKENRRIPGWNRLQTQFLADLAAAGYERETIDTVVCTHLHVDHVGWNTMLAEGPDGGKTWVPTFPNARYLLGRDEYRHWTEESRRDDMQAVFADSVLPVVAAGLVDLVDARHRICDEVGLVPSPGHTPGHVSVEIASDGATALVTGDFMHHPCQIARPDWSSAADSDPDMARRTRARMLARLSTTPTLVIGTHFAGRSAGHIVPDGDAYRLAE